MKKLLACALALASPSFLSAQATLVVGGQQQAALRAGLEIPMKTRQELTTKGKMLRVGQRFELETAEPISMNGQVVIPAGTPGVGEITSIRNKGMWGKSGNIEARALYLRVGDRQIRLSGVVNDKGVTGTAGVVGAIAFVPVAGFFMTGTSALIPLGAPVKAFLDEDVPVAFANGGPAQAPLMATAAAPVQAVASAGVVKTPAATLQPVVATVVKN